MPGFLASGLCNLHQAPWSTSDLLKILSIIPWKLWWPPHPHPRGSAQLPHPSWAEGQLQLRAIRPEALGQRILAQRKAPHQTQPGLRAPESALKTASGSPLSPGEERRPPAQPHPAAQGTGSKTPRQARCGAGSAGATWKSLTSLRAWPAPKPRPLLRLALGPLCPPGWGRERPDGPAHRGEWFTT